MSYKEKEPCLQKAFNDEMLFVLMARDASAPRVVIEWIKQSIGNQPPEKLHEALDCAIEMHNKFHEMNDRKAREKEGWNFVAKELPAPESNCEVLFENFTEGKLTYWSDEEGFDAQTEPHHIAVIAWRNPQRAI